MQKVTILGVTVTDLVLREQLKLAKEFTNNGALNTILCVDTKMFLLAENNIVLKEQIEGMDLLVCTEANLLRAAGLGSKNRIREIEQNEFIKEYIKNIGRQHNTILLVGEKEMELDILSEMLQSFSHEPLEILAKEIITTEKSYEFKLVNRINELAPQIIFSTLSLQRVGGFLSEKKNLLNVGAWVIFPNGKLNFHPKSRKSFWGNIQDKIFHKRLTIYNINKSKEEK